MDSNGNPQEDVGLCRFAVIAPLVARAMEREEYLQEVERVASSEHRFPGGLRRFSKRNVQRWVEWYREGRKVSGRVTAPGVEALQPQNRCDSGASKALSSEVVDRAEALRREQPKRTTRTLITLINAEYRKRNEEPPPIKENTLAKQLRKRQASRQAIAREGRIFPRYEHRHRNAVWQGDWSEGIRLPHPLDPKQTRLSHLHVFIDDHTRYVVHAEFYFRQNLPCLEDCFRKAVIKGGRPERTYWDNGAVYQALQIKRMAARLGIHIVFATPYHPQGKGKVERFFRTVQESFYPEAERAGIQTLAELNTFFWGWLEEHYHNRVHSELSETPRQRWEAGADRVEAVDPVTLADVFLWEEERVVNKAGCIEMSGNDYPVAEHLVGQAVAVRFDPFDLSQVRIYHQGHFIDSSRPLVLVAHTFRKAQPRHLEPLPLESSKTFREQLSAGYRAEISACLAQQRERGDANACLDRVRFAAAVSEAMGGHAFTVAEAAQVADFFLRYAPLPQKLVETALLAAVEDKGSDRHLRFYLGAVRHARTSTREVKP